MQRKTVQILSMLLFAGLLLWGGYALLSYLGVPVHGLVLLNDAGQKQVQTSCADGGFFCRGFAALLPSVLYSVGRAAPLLGYAFVCALLWLLLVGWRALVTGEGRVRVSWRPVYSLPLFLGLVWLLFTTFSAGMNDGMAVRQIVEPTSQAYGSLSGNQLQALKDNFEQLQGRGCLAAAGQAGEGINVYWMRNSCVQSAFMTTVFPPFLLVCVFLFELLVLGRFFLRLLRVRTRTLMEEVTLCAGIGAGGWIALLWSLAVAGLYGMSGGWILAAIIPLILWRDSLAWVRRVITPSPVDVSWRSVQLFLGWLLLSYLALNFLTVIRPFPIGWDDLGSYLNRPRLLVSYGHFIFPMSSFQWEYLTSLGWLLFGYDSVFGATAAMVINWTEGLLAVLAVFLFARTFLGRGRGLLSALLYYALPVVGHFSFADMKVDNAVFTMGALATYAIFVALFPTGESTQSSEVETSATGWRRFLPPHTEWIVLGGLFAGLAFGLKITSIMVILALLVVLLGTADWAALGAGIALAFLVILSRGLDLSVVMQRITGAASHTPPRGVVFAVLLLCIVAGIGFAAARRRWLLLPSLTAAGLFLISVAVAVAPWLLHNNLLAGKVIPELLLTAPNNFTPEIDFRSTGVQGAPGQDVRTLPAELRLDPKNFACGSTGGSEELDRYWGFGKGWSHYLTLPWRTVMNIDAPGYYVTTMPALLLFPLLLLLPLFWMKRGRWLRWLFLATSILIVEWVFLASGIPWYGIGMFLGLVVGLEALIGHAPDALNKMLAGALIAFSLMIGFAMRFWQFDQQRNLLEYPMGKVSADTLRIRTIPYYDQIRASVMERNASMPDRPYLYRVGTFIPYFIPRNLEVIGMTDHQLDAFNCLYQERNPELTLKRLKALGFNSIVFDTNTATIEQDPNGSLHKKVQEFVSFLNTPSLGLQIVVNDPPQGVAFILIP